MLNEVKWLKIRCFEYALLSEYVSVFPVNILYCFPEGDIAALYIGSDAILDIKPLRYIYCLPSSKEEAERSIGIIVSRERIEHIKALWLAHQKIYAPLTS